MTDAAIRENGNKPLSPQQFASLLLNMRYRVVFLVGEQKPIRWSATGTIDATEQNVAAIVEKLRRTNVL